MKKKRKKEKEKKTGRRKKDEIVSISLIYEFGVRQGTCTPKVLSLFLR